MLLTRRGLVACALLLPKLARAQGKPEDWRVLEARKSSLRLVPESAAETEVWGYDGQVPGPVLRLRKGEELRLRLVNKLDQPTALHVQGMRGPNAMDGVPGLTQAPVPPGGSFDYRFTPPDAGTYWYRPSAAPFAAEQKGRGLYGLLIVDEPTPPEVDREVLLVLDDWSLDAAGVPRPFLLPADIAGDGRIGSLVTANSHVPPESLSLSPGIRVRLRVLNACNARLAGLIFEGLKPSVIAVDGQACDPFEPARLTVPAGPGARFDLIFDMPAAPATILLRAGGLRAAASEDPPLPLLRFLPEGSGKAGRGPITGGGLNPLLPPVIKLQDAKRADLTIELRKSGDPLRTWSLNGIAAKPGEGKPVLSVKRGQPVSFGLVNKSAIAHTIHVHGHAMRILHPLDDGWEPYWRDAIIVPPGRTVRVALLADNPGKWLIESTILEHAMAGLTAWFEVT